MNECYGSRCPKGEAGKHCWHRLMDGLADPAPKVAAWCCQCSAEWNGPMGAEQCPCGVPHVVGDGRRVGILTPKRPKPYFGQVWGFNGIISVVAGKAPGTDGWFMAILKDPGASIEDHHMARVILWTDAFKDEEATFLGWVPGMEQR